MKLSLAQSTKARSRVNLSVTVLIIEMNRGSRIFGMFLELLRRNDRKRLLPLCQQVLRSKLLNFLPLLTSP